MNIDTAIALLKKEVQPNSSASNPSLNAAIRLGIEALKFCANFKRAMPQPTQTLLPGESKGEHNDY